MGDVARYLVAVRQAGLSVKTIEQYTWWLKKMSGWLLDRGVARLCDCDRELLLQWGAGLYETYARATVKQAVGAARSFYRWCENEGLSNGLADVLAVPSVPRNVQRTISLEEARLLLGACDDSVKGRRDAALILTLIDTALRASEVCRLQVVDLDLDHLCLSVVVKRGSRMAAHFGAATARRVQEWLEVRPMVGVAGEGAVFISVGGNTPGRALTTRGLRSILRSLGEKVGLAGVTTHAFRRGFCVIALIAGAPSRAVQAGGRWSRIEMVERYSLDWRRSEMYSKWSPGDLVSGV